MKGISDECKKNRWRIARSRGENPNLLILGENHITSPNSSITPEGLFSEKRPKYFFCEGVGAGLEINFAQYQKVVPQIRASMSFKESSFKGLIYGSLYDIGRGLSGIALTQWFAKSPGTTFVGIDLPDRHKREEQIIEVAIKAVEELSDYVAELLDIQSHELTDDEYKAYGVFRDFLYKEAFCPLGAYEAARGLDKIIRNAPGKVLDKVGVRSLFARVKKETKRFNRQRERSMGRTLADYVSKANDLSIAVVGQFHIRKDSQIFPFLDSNSIEYLAADLT